jgi:SpoVK/Ycf46/Vps4 family AAA+-type ATPase
MSDTDRHDDVAPRRVRKARPFAELAGELGNLAEVRAPDSCDPPILAPAVRSWLFGWLTEIHAAEDLATVGLKPRKTAVLHGPPGCGKTTLAHHLAARLCIPMVIVGPETLISSAHGASEGNVAQLFRVLDRSEVPCLLFMDELEAMGAKRIGTDSGGGAARANDNTLTVLLRKVEEFRGYLIGATNRPEDLDPALWRRFHMQREISLPGDDERFAILARYGGPFVWPEAVLDELVDVTDGASPALLRGLMEGVKRAAVLAPRLNRPIGTFASVVAAVTASVQPPPGAEPPLLWAGSGAPVCHDNWWPLRLPSP